ncbi:MAG: glycosyltransferase family 4 protein [Planctomycetota bacterium]|nr:glycosyltransferase family 4 protein [Planctomycetota bacterium]
MKLALVSSFVPFIKGGGTAIVEWLEHKLVEHGHQVETIFLPFVEVMDRMLDQMLAYRMLDITESVDRVIAFRPPAYLIRHPNKVLWFIHHFRAYYDLWDTEYRGCADNPATRAFRARLMDIDETALKESRSIYTNSAVVGQRLRTFNSVESTILYPPLLDASLFRSGSYGDTIVYVSRMEHHKRQHLLVEAMRHTRSPAKLVLAGKSHSQSYPRQLRLTAMRYGLSDRVQIIDRWISEEEKAGLLKNCRAAAYLPFDEDSYGYPSLEAHHACKSILTTSDSGGVMELVQDGVNGLVCEPTAEALAAAIDRLFDEPNLAAEMGHRGPRRMSELNINWDHVVEKLAA